MNIGEIAISSAIMNIIEIFSYFKISGEKINFKSLKLYLCYFLQTGLIILNYTYTANLMKVLCTFIIMIVVCKILFSKRSIIECFIIVFLTEVLIIFAELIFAIIISILNNLNTGMFAKIYQGTIFANCSIATILLLLLQLFKFNKIYKNILDLISNISKYRIIIFFSFVIFCGSILFYLSYYNTNKFFTLIVNFVITTVYFVIVLMIIKKESSYNKVYAKYMMTLNDLEEYEGIINEYRVINHENANQLNTIKGMIKNKKVQEYIDEILNNKNTKNEFILKQALLIPTGGLRGLIYSKLIVMKNNNVNYYLNIDKKFNSKDMKNISTKTMLNVCQIIGVYLDNAIDAVEKLDKKEIMINIYKENDIIIEIINNINRAFDINKIDKIGYTTKSGNHGYGLALVQNILKEDSNLLNEREISKNTFKQKLIIINK